jgi:predicted MFS family arabinose efflux permease
MSASTTALIRPSTETDAPDRPVTWTSDTGRIRPFLWRNYAGLALDGGLFTGGMAFIAADTVLPKAMESLGAGSLLIALSPVLVSIGFIWPQTLVAHRVERMHAFHRSVVLLGALQRLPYLLAGVALLLCGGTLPSVALACLVLAPFLCGTIGGIQVGAYIQMTRRILPDHRRASCMAANATIASLLGLAAGAVIHRVLADHPGATGYGILHLIAFGFLVLSLVAMMLLREPPPEPPTRPPLSLGENLGSLPGILREDRAFRAFVLMRILLAATGLVTPFLGLHALAQTRAGPEFLGLLVVAQTVGAILGNICSAWLGDRHGAGRPVFLGSAVLAATLCCLPWANGRFGFEALFAAYGFGWAANQVGVKTLALAIAPTGRLPTYSSMGSLLTLPAMLGVAFIGGTLHANGVDLPVVAILAGLCILGSVLFLRSCLTWKLRYGEAA